MKIAFFGLPLGALLLSRDGHHLTACVLSPVPAPGARRLRRAIGQARVLDARGVAPAALHAEVARRLTDETPDLLVSWYWTRRLPREWLELPPLGAIGVHPSLLPRHRGPDPFFWAIDAGDAVSGVSVHVLTEGYDEGAILAHQVIAIGGRNAWQLARALDRPGLVLLRCVVLALSRGLKLERYPQAVELVTWAPRPSDRELMVDWRWTTDRIVTRIRALSPVPGLALRVRGIAMEVVRAERASNFPVVLHPGEAAVVADPARVVIRTGDGAIEITRANVELAPGCTVELDGEAIAAEVARRLPDPVPS